MSDEPKDAPAAAAPATLKLPVSRDAIAALERIGKDFGLANIEGAGQFERAFLLSVGIQQLRSALTPELMKHIMPLQGSALGFLTDRDNPKEGGKGYALEVVRECLIEVTLRGFMPVGNEMNIISARFYGTKNGYARKVREFPGLTDLDLIVNVPRMVGDKGAIATCEATWKMNGVTIEKPFKREFAIRVNSGMGADAVVGKATRKLLAAIYGRLTGSELTLPEGEVDENVAAERAVNVTVPDGEVKISDIVGGASAAGPAEQTPAAVTERLSESQCKELRALAARAGVSMSAIEESYAGPLEELEIDGLSGKQLEARIVADVSKAKAQNDALKEASAEPQEARAPALTRHKLSDDKIEKLRSLIAKAAPANEARADFENAVAAQLDPSSGEKTLGAIAGEPGESVGSFYTRALAVINQLGG